MSLEKVVLVMVGKSLHSTTAEEGGPLGHTREEYWLWSPAPAVTPASVDDRGTGLLSGLSEPLTGLGSVPGLY